MLLLVPWMAVLNVFVLTHGCELLMRFKLGSMAFPPNNLLGVGTEVAAIESGGVCFLEHGVPRLQWSWGGGPRAKTLVAGVSRRRPAQS